MFKKPFVQLKQSNLRRRRWENKPDQNCWIVSRWKKTNISTSHWWADNINILELFHNSKNTKNGLAFLWRLCYTIFSSRDNLFQWDKQVFQTQFSKFSSDWLCLNCSVGLDEFLWIDLYQWLQSVNIGSIRNNKLSQWNNLVYQTVGGMKYSKL